MVLQIQSFVIGLKPFSCLPNFLIILMVGWMVIYLAREGWGRHIIYLIVFVWQKMSQVGG